MPELPDIVAYLDALRPRVVGRMLDRARIASPFVLRTVEPPVDALVGQPVLGLRRMGKRIIMALAGEHFLVIHLMIAGRLRWLARGSKPLGKIELARFEFRGDTPEGPVDGLLALTEAGSKKRASLHVVRGEADLARLNPGGLEVLEAEARAFRDVLRRTNHTLKRALTDPRLFSGIGNAYSDEILHAAGLSPIALTGRLTDEEADRLHAAVRSTLETWITRLREQFAGRFPVPGQITAFRPEFSVHGRFGKPCPVCGTAVQRIRYADNETNYCPKCQTQGRVLADRSLSRLLKDDWPRTVEELEGGE